MKNINTVRVLLAAALCSAGLASAQTRSFELNVQALQDKDKKTEVILSTKPVDGGAAPTTLKQVQLKSFDTAGNLRWTKNQSDLPAAGNPAVTILSYTDMVRYQPVQTQVLIQTETTTKTEVYKDKIPVLLRPDLTIQTLTASSQSVRPRQPVNITAVLRELNLDVGATVTLALKNGATQIDTRSGVVVQKGDTASVMFATQFDQVGTYTLTASIDGVAPRDYDTSNNSKTITIKVEEEPSYYSLSVYGDQNESNNIYTDPNWGVTTWSYKNSHERMGMHVWTSAQSLQPTFPVTLAGNFAVDGGPAQVPFSETVGVTNTYNGSCFKEDYAYKDLGNGTVLYAGQQSDTCGSGYTHAWSTAYRYAGEYIYFSEQHSAIYGSSSYSYNSSYGTMLKPQESVQARLTVTGSNGATFGGSGQTQLQNYLSGGNHEPSPPNNGTWKYRYFHGSSSGIATP